MKYLIIFTCLFSTNLFACYSDTDCGVGNVCVKPQDSYSISGTCITPVDEHGNQDFDIQFEEEGIGPREVQGCSFNTDCDVGFKCMKEAGQLDGICVQ